MSADWRMLALAALATAALTMACALDAAAQSASKASKGTPAPAAKKSADPDEAKAAEEEEEEERKPDAPAKRKKTDPAEVQRAVDAAAKLVEAGKTDQAVQSLTATLSLGNLPPATMAKAFMYRGMAYRQQQKPAQAIADLTSAIWLRGGLSPTDRSNATQQRSAAYREAGLTETGQALAAASPQAKEKSASGASGANWFSSTSTSAETGTGQSGQQGGGSGWSLFGGLFGGSGTGSAQTATSTTTTSASATTVKAVPETKSSSWASNTEVRSEPVTREPPARREPVTREPAAQEIETSAMPVKAEGRFHLQLAMVRSQGEAQALAAKVRREYAAALASREPEIDQTVVGNMGSFYRVVVGPFATQNDGQAACAKLKGSGLDCLVVTQ